MYIFIINPCAGNQRAEKIWSQLSRYLDRREISYHYYMTKYPRHAVQLTQSAIQQEKEIDAIVAIGGDGTVNEVIEGMVTSTIPFGYIPAGSGNDFARYYQIPSHPIEAFEIIMKKKTISIDIGKMTNGYFVSSLGAGFDAQIALKTNRSFYKKWLNLLGIGKLSYVITVLKEIFLYVPTSLKIIINEKEFHYSKVWFAAVTNIPYYGGGMKISPNAVPNDGMLEVIIVSQLNRWQLLRFFPQVFKGTHIHLPQVKVLYGSEITVNMEPSTPVHADGEIKGETPIKITLLQQKMNIIVPE
ncbi:diacylglycerol kinase family lipid kinase [Microaerobacter geothermalis]|uniref:diacylglycerol/lipid kinase family protein n=1 Tax=Microaerobacter geothermalis TaxID=674972 RepID=UPI001F2CE1A7|nr:diacylglycerol kinase family protein [Microaerobacter geothermalis]MCF6094666.1 diacylglycerol kinase family lipid kinase [Microaerobacter geothermalis]